MTPPAIQVRIWGKNVGAVAFDPQANAYAFEYYPGWVKGGVELAPLQMPLRGRRRFTFPELARPTYQGLPGMLADALPDRFGNALIDAWMARKGIRKDQVTALDRLAYMGRRGAGALEFRPALGSVSDAKTPLRMARLVEEARRAVQGSIEGDRAAGLALAEIIRVGTSAGGARAKAVIAWNPATQELRSGQFEVPEGFQHWLLKFDGLTGGGEFGDPAGHGRVEYAYHLMARAAGIEMADCRLLEEHGRAHFMTRRFDREAGGKVHLQSLCALAHLDFNQVGVHAYGQAFMTLKALSLAPESTDELFRRMAFNVMARNCDDHPKNVAFILRPGGTWRLAPAYDLTFSYRPGSTWVSQQFMSVNGRFQGITRQDFLTEADRFSVRNPAGILAEVSAALDAFPEWAAKAELAPDKAEGVARQFLRL
ncbi:type II toxin-antitoxin system HipA family toxin [Mesoterricola silvestris]|uniref:Toxin HipA n=1 Tax=Mesoterricola silvestris TaxID=2927979 RepID=A0AA48K9D2_9BACT|nr:type II toxin-antitoxin system HipA family toxin [Mesoterricola silvestris]BDU73879.1 toxin HipA [Mesoterricola silvestris]